MIHLQLLPWLGLDHTGSLRCRVWLFSGSFKPGLHISREMWKNILKIYFIFIISSTTQTSTNVKITHLCLVQKMAEDVFPMTSVCIVILTRYRQLIGWWHWKHFSPIFYYKTCHFHMWCWRGRSWFFLIIFLHFPLKQFIQVGSREEIPNPFWNRSNFFHQRRLMYTHWINASISVIWWA